jgi:hypothetical protein
MQIFSVILIIYVLIKKLNKINLLIPVIYLVIFYAIAITGFLLNQGTRTPLDLSYTSNLIGVIVTYAFYLIEIGLSIFLLSKVKIGK